MRCGRSCFTLALAMAEECGRYCAWLSVLHTSRKQRLFFFFSGFVACFVSSRNLFLLLWFRTIREEKGVTVCGRFLESFHPRIFFLQLNERRVFGNQEKMARWDSDDFSPRGPTFCEILLAIILPPIGVFLKYGCAVEFWLCVLLTLIGYLPGILYAIYVLVQ